MQPLFSLPARATQGWRVEWELKQLIREPTEGLASPTRVVSEGFRATALCLGWKKKAGGDVGRILTSLGGWGLGTAWRLPS